MANQLRPKAVLWDFDGTLMDSEPIWVTSEIEIADEYGVSWTHEDGARISGMSWKLAMNEFFDTAHAQGITMTDDRRTVYEKICHRVASHLSEREPTWIPGSKKLVLDLASAGVPLALVSASPMEILAAGVSALPEGTFSTIIDGGMVVNGKPHPEGYLKAASNLGVDASECIILEDSHSGTSAALASGGVVVKVKSYHEVDDHPRLTRVDDLTTVDWPWLVETYAALANAR